MDAASDYLDDMRKRDEKEYHLTVDLQNQVSALERIVGEERTSELFKELTQAKVEVAETYRRVPVNVTILDSAITGEALDKLSKRPTLGDVPSEAFGQLFSVNLSQVRLQDHLSSRSK